MKLIRLKLLSSFRGLKQDFEIIFDKRGVDIDLSEPKKSLVDDKEYIEYLFNDFFEPICFVGLNGAGKSNILEALSEIFFYLEGFSKIKNNSKKKHKKYFGFEIEYLLPSIYYNEYICREQQKSDSEFVYVKITKKPLGFPVAYTKIGILKYTVETADEDYGDYEHYEIKKAKAKKSECFLSLLPNKIIGYSSGMNELISNPYIKMDFNYLQEFEKRTGESVLGSLDMNRMFFMDYNLNKLITICNFLFDEPIDDGLLDIRNIEPLKRKIRIERLHSFTIDIRLRKEDKTPIELPSELNIAIDKLQKCATLSRKNIEKTSKGEYSEYTLSYWVDKETKKAFQYHFKTAFELFKSLYFLRLLNNHLVGRDTQRDVLKADIETNISAMLPKHEAKKKLFHISNIALKKQGVRELVYYEQLSDGEHQFLHVIGTVILMEYSGILFLLDEPETHFNPEWRSQFVSILNECMETKYKRRAQEILLTTHSPFIVSDCKKDKVFIFERKGRDNKVKPPKNPGFETYGTSIEMIYWNIFGKHETISKMALGELDKIKEKIINKEISKEDAARELLKFGNSMERMNITKLLMDQKD